MAQTGNRKTVKSGLDVRALYEALEEERVSRGLSWREVARSLSLSPSIFSRMRQGKRPDVDTFAALVQWLDLPAERFFRGFGASTAKGRPLALISTVLRSDDRLSRADATALQEILRAAYKRFERSAGSGGSPSVAKRGARA
jgi:transcriptional regulator with XRE-family HTH domain